jgi:hypothetical protein
MPCLSWADKLVSTGAFSRHLVHFYAQPAKNECLKRRRSFLSSSSFWMDMTAAAATYNCHIIYNKKTPVLKVKHVKYR